MRCSKGRDEIGREGGGMTGTGGGGRGMEDETVGDVKAVVA